MCEISAGLVDSGLRAQSRRQERARIQIQWGVAGHRVNVLLACCPLRSTSTRRPAPGLLPLGFRAGKIVHQEEKATRITDSQQFKEAKYPNACVMVSVSR